MKEWLKGIILQVIKEIIIESKGAIIKIKKFAELGVVTSFIINFKASAMGCKIPKPTIFGPFLLWIVLITLRSAKVKNAILKIIGRIYNKKAKKDTICCIKFLMWTT